MGSTYTWTGTTSKTWNDGRNWSDGVRMKLYGYHAPGFWRMNIWGWRFVLIDTRKHRAMYSDRVNGWRIGRFIVRASRLCTIVVIEQVFEDWMLTK